ncbi:hypothetical protein [Fodinibius salsisoli]|uniref:Outer membrane beta-barrel protein n=1 Tax=Fodinibius salsisoli TaxID=2820877 RepID=A0ABT3PQV9_9BACT|nr:hypothetical protein [Fodinibius salsisoli]MCW9708216.1 outer membrane beta-barrel protein [Fodinibius salsisoli]
MKYYLFVGLLIIGSTAYGQNMPSGEMQNNKFQLGFFYSTDQNLSGDQVKIDEYMGYETEYDQYNFLAGLTTTYSWRTQWALRSGLTYADRSFTGTFYCHVCDFITSPQPQSFDLAFVQVPIAIRYYPYRKRVSLFGELGILNQLMVKEPVISRLEANTYSLSSLIAAGIAYNISQQFSAQLSVQYSNGWSKLFKETDYSYQILGIELSLLKHF